MRRRIGMVLGALALLAGCAGGGPSFTSARDPAAAARAWERAWVLLPGESQPRRLEDAAPRLARYAGSAMPVVVFAHGCRGFDAAAAETLRVLAAHGFASIAPDHAARPDAHPPCRAASERPLSAARPARRDGGLARVAPAGFAPPPEAAYVRSRLDEVGLALERLRAAPWADPAGIFLVGESLGRGTAGLWPTRGLAAVAVLGQDCRGASAAAQSDLPLVIPVLPLADRRGPVHAETARATHCREQARTAGEALLVGLGARDEAAQGAAHEALLDLLLGATRPI